MRKSVTEVLMTSHMTQEINQCSPLVMFCCVAAFVLSSVFSCFDPTRCLSHQHTTVWERQERGEQSLEGHQGLWGMVLSNCRGLCASATDSGPCSRLYTAGRRPEGQTHEIYFRRVDQVCRGKHNHMSDSPESRKQTGRQQLREHLVMFGLLSSDGWCVGRSADQGWPKEAGFGQIDGSLLSWRSQRWEEAYLSCSCSG